MIGPLPESQGNDAIAVIVNRFTKQIIVIPTMINLTSEGMARIFRDNVFKHHGIPKKIISDRGPQFASKFMADFYRLLGITRNLSTAFHPQTDGQTEQINQEIEQYLRIFVNHRQSDWTDWLSLAEFSYNDKVHLATSYSPFYLVHGRHPYKGGLRQDPRNKSAGQFVERKAKTREDAAAALERAADTMKRFYDRTKGTSVEYQPGDKVWLEGTNIRVDRPTPKLAHKRYRPFEVIEKVGSASYRLKLPKSWRKVHPVFNEVLLSPYHPPSFPIQTSPPIPPPDLIEDHLEYEVEKILDCKLYRGHPRFLVAWKGYGPEENTWEPVSNLKNAGEELELFYRCNPSAPRNASVSGVLDRLSLGR